MSAVAVSKLRTIAKLCRAVLAIDADGRRDCDVRFSGTRKMAARILEIMREKGTKP